MSIANVMRLYRRAAPVGELPYGKTIRLLTMG